MVTCTTLRSAHRLSALVVLAGTMFGGLAVAGPINTDPAGSPGTQPFNNMQPSLALHFAFPLQGAFGNGVPVRMFAYSDSKMSQLTGGVWIQPAGQLLPVSQNQALFAQLGTNFGGNGASTFALPDLRGKTPIGEGQGFGTSNYVRGQSVGQATQTMTVGTMPAHSHTHAKAVTGVTSVTGGGQAIGSMQPSLAMNWEITVTGPFPPLGGSGTASTPNAPYLGQVMLHAATPGGTYTNLFSPCNAGLIPVSQNTGLFALIGTSYGGNGQTTFGKPDLRGSTAAHTGQGPGIEQRVLGEIWGNEVCPISVQNLPTHLHTVALFPGQPPLGSTGFAGGSQPFSNAQRSLAINYLIYLQGAYPDANSQSESVNYLGEIIVYAGNNTPTGYARCDGQLLPIAQNQALFSLLGTSFGGNGVSTFALPDLRGRVPVGASLSAGGYPAGTVLGTENVTLTSQNMPWHTHTLQPYCPADIGMQGGLPGHDGYLDNNDFIAFISLFFGSNPIADFGMQGGLAGSDGHYDNNDFIAFISAFFSDCPWN
ncbi:MAG: tail fiber protein [Phycisphaerales bacterium]